MLLVQPAQNKDIIDKVVAGTPFAGISIFSRGMILIPVKHI
jgi:hypothetical protein